MLHINNPQYADERTASKPLSLEEQKYAAWLINEGYATTGELNTELIQRLLYHYENLQALSDFIGGWEGARKLTAEWVSVDDFLPEDIDDVILYDSEQDEVVDNVSYYKEDGGMFVAHGKGAWKVKNGRFTHWRPLPPKPLVKDKD